MNAERTGFLITTNGTYPKISRNGQSRHGCGRIHFEMMTSTRPPGSIGSVAALLAVPLYQGNHDSILCQHVEQTMLTLSEHLRSATCFSGVRVLRSLVCCVVFCRSFLPFCIFSFGRCIICSPNYDFCVERDKVSRKLLRFVQVILH